jgi:hypothetical protein
MIVNYTANGWEVITQRAHGLLSAKIAQAWKYDIRTIRWTETLLAIAEHDDGQVELEQDDLLTEQGGPINFKMKEYDPAHCRRTLDFALSKSRYIALLCAMHLEFVYGKPAAEESQCALWRKELKLTKTQAQKDYDLLEWCDALSLLLCQHLNQPEMRNIEISQGHQLVQLDPDVLTVKPWPFEEKEFTLTLETRLIPQLVFRSAQEFRSEFKKGVVKEKLWRFQR